MVYKVRETCLARHSYELQEMKLPLSIRHDLYKMTHGLHEGAFTTVALAAEPCLDWPAIRVHARQAYLPCRADDAECQSQKPRVDLLYFLVQPRMVSHTLTGDGGTSPESSFDYDFHDELPIIDVYMASNRAPNSPDATW